jgi:hypothetical protein
LDEKEDCEQGIIERRENWESMNELKNPVLSTYDKIHGPSKSNGLKQFF